MSNPLPSTDTLPFSPQAISLRTLLEDQLRDLYDAEVAYSKFLMRMEGNVENSDLEETVDAMRLHTCEHIQIIEEICAEIGVPPTGVRCAAMEGLLREAAETADGYESGAVKDAALIANAQRITHYEIAGFGTCKAFANKLALSTIEKKCSEMLADAIGCDKRLTKTATGSWLSHGVNDLAAASS